MDNGKEAKDILAGRRTERLIPWNIMMMDSQNSVVTKEHDQHGTIGILRSPETLLHIVTCHAKYSYHATV